MSTQQDINAFRAQRLANTHDPLALMANTQTPFHLDQSSLITNLQHPQPNNNFVQQPSFNMNYMPQPMQNLEDISDPTTAMNKALDLIAKAFKINTIPTNNNQRSSLIPRNNQITQSDMNTSQDIKMQMVDDNVGNQVRQNAVQNDGNEVGQNAVSESVFQILKNMNGLVFVLEIANRMGMELLLHTGWMLMKNKECKVKLHSEGYIAASIHHLEFCLTMLHISYDLDDKTLREWYENVGIMHQTFVARTMVTDIAQKDKNKSNRTKPSMGMERVREIKTEGVYILNMPTRFHLNGPGHTGNPTCVDWWMDVAHDPRAPNDCLGIGQD
ncbi:hypothetical protein Tco_0589160 [Tanacetum coccineum]